MAGVVSTVCKGITITCDLLGLLDSAAAIGRAEGEERGIRIASSISRLAMLCFQVSEVVAYNRGASIETLSKIKGGENVFRLGNASCKPLEARYDSETFLEYIEKGLLAPMADFIISAAQADIYTEQRYIQALALDANAQRPIRDDDGWIIGYKPIVKEECTGNIETLKKISENTALARMAFEAKAVSRIGSSCLGIYESIISYFRVNGQASGQAYETIEQLRSINLLDLEEIPAPLHGDAIFRRYTCAIGYEPIRRVVADPTTGGSHLYERSTITRWLRRNSTSPMTRERLVVDDLLETPAIQMIINERLRYHQQHLQEYIEANYIPEERLEAPAPADLDARAREEFPDTGS